MAIPMAPIRTLPGGSKVQIIGDTDGPEILRTDMPCRLSKRAAREFYDMIRRVHARHPLRGPSTCTFAPGKTTIPPWC